MTSALHGGEGPIWGRSHFTSGETTSQYQFDRRLSEPQRLSARYGEEKNIVPAEKRTPVVHPVARYNNWAILENPFKLEA
jgi:hypothetical protein